MDNMHEVIEKFETTDKEIRKKRMEFEDSIRYLLFDNDTYLAKIIERATTLLDRLTKYNIEHRPNGGYFYGEINFDDELTASAKLKKITSINSDSIEFWAEESWSFGGYAEGYITIPKAYLEANIDNLGWFFNLESNHNTLEEIKDKIRQIDELSAKIKQLQDECGINTPNS